MSFEWRSVTNGSGEFRWETIEATTATVNIARRDTMTLTMI